MSAIPAFPYNIEVEAVSAITTRCRSIFHDLPTTREEIHPWIRNLPSDITGDDEFRRLRALDFVPHLYYRYLKIYNFHKSSFEDYREYVARYESHLPNMVWIPPQDKSSASETPAFSSAEHRFFREVPTSSRKLQPVQVDEKDLQIELKKRAYARTHDIPYWKINKIPDDLVTPKVSTLSCLDTNYEEVEELIIEPVVLCFATFSQEPTLHEETIQVPVLAYSSIASNGFWTKPRAVSALSVEDRSKPSDSGAEEYPPCASENFSHLPSSLTEKTVSESPSGLCLTRYDGTFGCNGPGPHHC